MVFQSSQPEELWRRKLTVRIGSARSPKNNLHRKPVFVVAAAAAPAHIPPPQGREREVRSALKLLRCLPPHRRGKSSTVEALNVQLVQVGTLPPADSVPPIHSVALRAQWRTQRCCTSSEWCEREDEREITQPYVGFSVTTPPGPGAMLPRSPALCSQQYARYCRGRSTSYVASKT